MPKIKQATLKALELDDKLAEAHYLSARTAFWHDYDWATAEREMKRAAELDRRYSVYPLYLSAMGRHDEAIAAQEKQRRNSPLDIGLNSNLEAVYLFAGRYDQVIEQAKKTLEIDPNYWGSYSNSAQAHERKGQYAEAIAALEKARSLDGNNPSILAYLGHVYATVGDADKARKILADLNELSKQRYVSPYCFAAIHAGLNERDKAFEWLDRAYEVRSYYMALLGVDTVFDNLRGDPRFADLKKRLNLP